MERWHGNCQDGIGGSNSEDWVSALVVFEWRGRKPGVYLLLCMRLRRAIAHRVRIMATCGCALQTHTLKNAMSLLKWLVSSKVCRKMSRERQTPCVPGAPRSCWGPGCALARNRVLIVPLAVSFAPLCVPPAACARHSLARARNLVCLVTRPRLSLVLRAQYGDALRLGLFVHVVRCDWLRGAYSQRVAHALRRATAARYLAGSRRAHH